MPNNGRDAELVGIFEIWKQAGFEYSRQKNFESKENYHIEQIYEKKFY